MFTHSWSHTLLLGCSHSSMSECVRGREKLNTTKTSVCKRKGRIESRVDRRKLYVATAVEGAVLPFKVLFSVSCSLRKRQGFNRWTDPGSTEIYDCDAFLGRSDSRRNTCRRLVRSCQCTAARREKWRIHLHLGKKRPRVVHADISLSVITPTHACRYQRTREVETDPTIFPCNIHSNADH